MDRRELLDRAAHSPEERLLLSRVWDKCEQCRTRNIPTATGFLSPQEQTAAQHLLNALGCWEGYVLWGGYDGAERRRLVFLPDWLETPDDQVAAVRAACRSGGDLTHRDFLGSLMGMGIVREKIGDVLVGPDSADVLVLDTVAEFLAQSWESAGRVKLRVAEIDPGCVHIPEIRREERRDTVSSLRLDAVCSTGFRMARGKAAALIESGRVQLNWRECTKPDRTVSEGDTVSARGFGKFELTEVGALTKKGRIPITVQCYK